MASPNWGPLEAALPPAQMDDWMWMGEVEHEGRVIQRYKNYWTRKYVNIDQDGKAWLVTYDASSKTPDVDPIPLAEAIKRATS